MSFATEFPSATDREFYFDVSATVPVPLRRLVAVEVRKLVDTRSGRWLLIIQALLIVVASAVVTIVVAVLDEPVAAMDYIGLAGLVMALLLPVMGILAITSEWSQRTNMATFTLEPRRVKVAAAKMIAVLLAGMASVVLAIVVGFAASGIAAVMGVDVDWAISGELLAGFAVIQILGLLTGFAFGTLMLNTPAAIVSYFASFTIAPALFAAAGELSWFADIRSWIDFANAQLPLSDVDQDPAQIGFDAVHWPQFVVAGTIWLVLPLCAGVWRIARAEVK